MAESSKSTKQVERSENPIMPIRLGVLIDADRVPNYVNKMLAELSNRPDMELAAVVVHQQHQPSVLPAHGRSDPVRPSHLAWLGLVLTKGALHFLTGLETLIPGQSNPGSNPLRAEPIHHPLCSITRITPLTVEGGAQCSYSQADLDLLKGLALDFLVVESRWDPVLEARSSFARYGAIKLRFGELSAVPTCQAGFREVCRRNPCSKFRIVLLDGRGDTSIFEGAFQTRLSLAGNRNALIRKAYPYLGQAIAAHFAQPDNNKPAHTGAIEANHNTAVVNMLSIREILGSLFSRVNLVRIQALNVALGRDDCWQVAWYRGCWQEVGVAKSNVVENPRGSFLADPFVIEKEGRHICFVEEYSYRKDRGAISAVELTETSSRMLGTVLEESFHLSFPFLFEFGSQLYLCPETSEVEQIRVYECKDFPTQWKLCKVLMDRVRAADTMLVEHNGRWWMFTNIDPQGLDDFESRLYLFWSDSPLSTVWEPHPQNPVVFDPLSARNAGFVTRDGELFRCAQSQGFLQYGEAFSIRKITEWTTERYTEQCYLEVLPETFGASGTHHFHHNEVVVARDECRIKRASVPRHKY